MSSAVLVLCYHAIVDLSTDPVLAEYGIEREAFAAQLDRLLARGFAFISPDELIGVIEGHHRLPRRAVLLTFDDCYDELSHVARSILQPRSIPAIAFAVSGMQSGTNEWDQAIGARALKLLDAAGLRDLRECGVEIGSHSRSHRPMAALTQSELAQETRAAADDITRMGIPTPRFFAYPHGEQDARVRLATQDAGFVAAFALAPRSVTRRSERFALPRVEILASDSGGRFWLKTTFPRMTRILGAPHLLQRTGAKFRRAAHALARGRG